jgi:tetratricopeptide (TPR) repeat protein
MKEGLSSARNGDVLCLTGHNFLSSGAQLQPHQMNVKRTLQITGIILTIAYGCCIIWLYVRQPRSLEEIKTQAAVEINVYSVKRENFDEAVKQFNAGQYALAIDQFQLADAAERDPATQFYIAYSYYLLGRGKFNDDDELFKKGLAAVERCLANAPNQIYESERTDLEIRSAAALRERFKEGLDVTPSDFNPFNWFKKTS